MLLRLMDRVQSFLRKGVPDKDAVTCRLAKVGHVTRAFGVVREALKELVNFRNLRNIFAKDETTRSAFDPLSS